MRPHRRYLISLFSILARLVSPSPSSVRYIMQPPLHVSSPFFPPLPPSLSLRLTDRRYRFFPPSTSSSSSSHLFISLPIHLLMRRVCPLFPVLYLCLVARRLSALNESQWPDVLVHGDVSEASRVSRSGPHTRPG